MKHTILRCFLFSLLFSIIPVFAQDDTNLADLATITRADGVTLHIESFTYQDTAGRYTPANGVYLVMLMTIENPTDDQQCIRARDIRLLYNGEDYPPEAALMGAVQAELKPRRDYVGPLSGHCVDAGESAPSFAAFDVPAGMDTFDIRFDDVTQRFADLQPVDTPPTSTPEPTIPRPTAPPTTPRPSAAATATPRPAANSDTADAQTLSDGIFILAGGRDVQGVKVADGRANGGERVALITYVAHESEATAFLGEFIDILDAAAATIRAKELDLDSIILVVGNADGSAAGTIATSVADLLDYHQGRITLSQYVDRLTITQL